MVSCPADSRHKSTKILLTLCTSSLQERGPVLALFTKCWFSQGGWTRCTCDVGGHSQTFRRWCVSSPDKRSQPPADIFNQKLHNAPILTTLAHITHAGHANTQGGAPGGQEVRLPERRRPGQSSDDGFLMEIARMERGEGPPMGSGTGAGAGAGAGRGSDTAPGRQRPGAQQRAAPSRDVFTSWENLLTVLAVLESVQVR